ncbi:hypothetical protein [Actinomadura sp. 3N407]|uniref:hypothetical protein n=1 Tax=Actinomadura sp. 3N407 TaxID=3457423 RepID=UPI003FCD9EC5
MASKRRATAAERADEALRALEQRRRGVPVADIARDMGLPLRTVQRRVALGLELLGEGLDPEELRRAEEDRLDDLLRRAHGLLDREDLTVTEQVSILRLIRDIGKDRVHLFGVAVPSKTVIEWEMRGADDAGQQTVGAP